jgi:excisionase family DNA binding protein
MTITNQLKETLSREPRSNMRSHSNQFAVRENTASSRQHAPRFASSEESSCSSPNDDASPTTTNRERDEGHLLTVHEVAQMLQVPVSWVYEHTRTNCAERIPGFRLGKYWRFNAADLAVWLAAKRRNDYHHA